MSRNAVSVTADQHRSSCLGHRCSGRLALGLAPRWAQRHSCEQHPRPRGPHGSPCQQPEPSLRLPSSCLCRCCIKAVLSQPGVFLELPNPIPVSCPNRTPCSGQSFAKQHSLFLGGTGTTWTLYCNDNRATCLPRPAPSAGHSRSEQGGGSPFVYILNALSSVFRKVEN